MTALRWWDDQPAPVRAVLDLADLRDDATPDVHDGILAAFAPQHADEIVRIAGNLGWIERLGYDYPSIVLSDDHGTRCAGDLGECDTLADRLRDEVLTSAQFIASLLAAGRVAA